MIAISNGPVFVFKKYAFPFYRNLQLAIFFASRRLLGIHLGATVLPSIVITTNLITHILFSYIYWRI